MTNDAGSEIERISYASVLGLLMYAMPGKFLSGQVLLFKVDLQKIYEKSREEALECGSEDYAIFEGLDE